MPDETPRRVLIAEDDAAMRTMVVRTLERSGVVVDAVSDGKALVEWVEAACRADVLPDLIVSDVVMPEMNGLDALAAIHRIAPGVRVVLITAFGSRRTHERARALGAAAVFDKPFDLGEFDRSLRRLLMQAPQENVT